MFSVALISFNSSGPPIEFIMHPHLEANLFSQFNLQFSRCKVVVVGDIVCQFGLMPSIGQPSFIVIAYGKVYCVGERPFQVCADRPKFRVPLIKGLVVITESVASEEPYGDITRTR